MRSNSENSGSFVHPARLVEAADAILHAQAGPSGRQGVVAMWTDPKTCAREGFTSAELIEAYMFLCRLGVLENSEHPHG
jgi:hypothetical protein